jgi:hypothetical protein
MTQSAVDRLLAVLEDPETAAAVFYLGQGKEAKSYGNLSI